MDSSKQLGEDKIPHLLLKFSIPAIVGMLVQALYNIVDRIFIGHGVSHLGIAGITIAFPVMLIIMAFSMLIGIGATSLISIRLGEKKKDEAEEIMGNALILLFTIAIIISLLGQTFLKPLLMFFGANESIYPYARDYISIILWGTVFSSLSFGMNNFIRAEGNPRIAMYTMLIGALTNVVLDYIFIFIFHWGMQGAALATIISQMVSMTWVLSYFLGNKSLLKIRRKNLKLKRKVVAGILAIGSAPFAVQMGASFINVILNNGLKVYGGDIAIAGMGIVNSFVTIIMMPIFGINQGCQPLIGYNFGAKKYDRVLTTLKLGIIAATTIVTIGFFVVQFFPSQIITMFSKEEPELISFGVKALKTYLVFLPLIGFQIVGGQYFQAVGKPRRAIFLSLSRQVLILIPLLLILPRYHGLNGILYAGPSSDLVSSLLTGFFLFRELKYLEKISQTTLVLQNN